MSGRKQHYIPQSLLKGFAARITSKKTYVWVHERHKAPYCPATEGVGAARHFYSTPEAGVVTLDDVITDEVDNQLGRLLLHWRQAADGTPVDPHIASALVANLSIRGAFLRDVFSKGVAALHPLLKSCLSDRRWLRAHTRVDRDRLHPSLQSEIDRVLAEELEAMPIALPTSVLRRMIKMHLREQFDSLFDQGVMNPAALLEAVFGQVDQVVERAHRNTLRQTLAPVERTQFLSTLGWTIQFMPQHRFVLPDCVSLHVDGNGGRPYVFQGRDAQVDLGCVVVPIAIDRVLVGAAPNHDAPDLTEMNDWSARSSHTFFVASERSPLNDVLQTHIGEWSSTSLLNITAKDLEENVGSVVGELGADVTVPAEAPIAKGVVSLHLQVPEEWDEQLTAAVIEATRTLVLPLGKMLPLSQLDRIAFLADIEPPPNAEPKAAAAVPPEHRTHALEAYVNAFRQDDETRYALVIRESVGRDLAAGDKAACLSAASTLMRVVAEAAYCAMLDERWRKGALNVALDLTPVEQILFPATNGIGSAYFTSRFVSDVSPTTRQELRERCFSLLQAMADAIRNEKVRFQTHQNIDQTIQVVLAAIQSFLAAMAAYLGDIERMDQRAEALVDMEAALRLHGLADWIRTFEQDLQPFAKDLHRLVARDVLRLTSHVERMLWAFGMLCIEQPDARVFFRLLPTA